MPAPDIRSQATKKLEDVVLKSMQIVQSQSYRQITSGGEVVARPSPTYDALYAAIIVNNTARPMVLKKRDIAFREGIKIEPNFTVKCMMCESEYDHKMDRCEKCNAMVRMPDPDEEQILKGLLELENVNFQTLQDVLEEISVDHDIVDDGWLVSRNVYQELNGQIVDFEITEFWRIHPGNVAFSMSEMERIGEFQFTCIYHRDYYSFDEFSNCGNCGRILHKVIAVRYKDQDIVMRYIQPEIYHGSEYNPSAIYGFPPALTMWYDLILTAAQTKFMADYYVDKKWPSAALFVPAKQRKTAELFRDKLDQEVNKDVQGRPVFRFDPDSKHKPEVIRMTDTPEEMQFIEVREESRMRMAAFWGISPIFNMDVQASGGLNNESRQITVMSWATEKKQSTMKKSYLDRICKNKGIQDWHMELGQIEEEDEAAEIQLDNLKADYATKMISMGFTVDLDDEGKPTKFEKMQQSQDPFSQMIQPDMENPNMPLGGAEPPSQQTTMGKLSGQESVMQTLSAKSNNFDLKGFTPETFGHAITEGSVIRGHGGRFAKNVRKESRLLIREEIKESAESEQTEGEAIYELETQKVEIENRLESVEMGIRSTESSLDYINNKGFNETLLERKQTYEEELTKYLETRENIEGELFEINQELDLAYDETTLKEAKEIRRLDKLIDRRESKIKETNQFLDEDYVVYEELWKKGQRLGAESVRTSNNNKYLRLREEINVVFREQVEMSKTFEKRKKSISRWERETTKLKSTRENNLNYVKNPEYRAADEFDRIDSKVQELEQQMTDSYNRFNDYTSSSDAELAAMASYNQSIKETDNPKKKESYRIDAKKAYNEHLKYEDLKDQNWEKHKEIVDRLSELEKETDYKNLGRKTKYRKNKHWGYVDVSEFRPPEGLRGYTLTRSVIRRMFKDEWKSAIKVLGIDISKHPEVNAITLEIYDDNPEKRAAGLMETSGWSSFHRNRININPTQHRIQETIRHEIAHHMASLRMFPDYFKWKKGIEELEDMNVSRFNDKYSNLKGKITNANYQLRLQREKYEDDPNKSKGHGDKWRDTMEALFNRPMPKHKYGDMPIFARH